MKKSGAPKTVRDGLIAARAKISNPENWTQGQLARTATGRMCGPRSPRAVSWCATGAIEAVGLDSIRTIIARRNLAAANLSHLNLASFNDNGTHAEVLALFDRAIEAVS